MAVLIVYLDDKGNVTRLERREQESFERQAKDTFSRYRAVERTVIDPRLSDHSEMFTIREVARGIDTSPNLTEEQREEARRVFGQLVPGDPIVFQGDPIFRQGGDVGGRAKPLFTVFVDP